MPRIVVAQAAVNVFLDFYILVIPLQEVLKLNLNLRKKLGVLALFGIGSSACAVSVVRVAFSIKHMEEKDLFWSAVLTSELSIVEMNVLIIAPSLLFLPAFIKTSKTGLNSFRLKVLSRSRLDGSQQSSLHYKKDSIAVQIKHQPSQELDFITEPVDHGAQTKRSAKQGDNDWKRESDVYSPV